jgi:(p)ppGpp synthase/HD superfamily hydrolase
VAQGIAVTAHRDQVDKAGLPYIEHPRRVAELVAAAGGSDEAVAAAWLHDVLEDTDLTPEDLRVAGIPEEVVAAVRAVTHRCGERLDDYAKRVAADPLAVQVKRADLADNTDPDRLGKLSAKDNDRLRAKYELMRSLLDDAAPADPAPAS